MHHHHRRSLSGHVSSCCPNHVTLWGSCVIVLHSSNIQQRHSSCFFTWTPDSVHRIKSIVPSCPFTYVAHLSMWDMSSPTGNTLPHAEGGGLIRKERFCIDIRTTCIWTYVQCQWKNTDYRQAEKSMKQRYSVQRHQDDTGSLCSRGAEQTLWIRVRVKESSCLSLQMKLSQPARHPNGREAHRQT